MKRFLCLLLALFLILGLIGCNSAKKDFLSDCFIAAGTSAGADDIFEKVSEDDNLILSINRATTDISITDKRSGSVWSTSNKINSDGMVYNILYLTYRTENGGAGVLASTSDSVQKGQYKIEPCDNGAKVTYTLGEVNIDYIYPETLTPERYEYFYNKCSDDDKLSMEIIYTKYDISTYDETTQQEMNAKWPYAVDGIIYAPRTALNDALKAEISAVFKRLGYTEDDLKTDHTEFKKNDSINIAVNVSVYYTLKDGKLSVKVPYGEIINDSELYIESLNILENFSSASMNNGYFLLPDGSGSVMNFYNGKHERENYRTEFYGYDNSIKRESNPLYLKNASFPVFGSVSDGCGYFAEIKDGSAHANLNAFTGTSERTPRIWVDISVDEKDYLVAEGNTQTGKDNKLETYQKYRYNGAYEVDYLFLSGDKANYSYMANYYGDALTEGGVEEINKYPLALEIINAIDINEKKFGFDLNSIKSLTDFSETEDIALELKNMTSADICVMLRGWNKGGLRYGFPKSVAPINSIGGKNGLAKLKENLNKNNIDLILDFDVQYASENNNVQGSYVSRFMDSAKVQLYNFDLAVFGQNLMTGYRYAINSNGILKGIKTVSDYREKGDYKVSLCNIGKDLNSDYNSKNETDRETAKNSIVSALKEFSGVDAIRGTNSYVVPFAENIFDVDTLSNRQDMTDYSVPFVSMVLSGRKEYFAPSLNLADFARTDLLRVIESNAGASVTVTKRDTKDIDTGGYDNLYFTAFDDIKTSVTSAYEYLNSALSDSYGKKVVSHEYITDGVCRIDYENGKFIIINYNSYDVNVDGADVKAKDFVKGEKS